MKKSGVRILAAVGLGFFMTTAGFADEAQKIEPPKHEFIGAAKCAICHKKTEQGEQYLKWQESKHSRAFEILGTPEAKAAAAKRGIDDPQTSGACLKCHSTAYWFSEARVTDKIEVEEGVSCETCHGPGKDYMKKSVMKDREASVKAGLIIPTEKTCLQCHNEESPDFHGFDYEEYQKKIDHPVPR
jgi:hypothetical protein